MRSNIGSEGIKAEIVKVPFELQLGANQMIKPKRCIKNEADMLKKPVKAIKFYYDIHDCIFNLWCILQKGWLAKLKGYKVSLVGLFHHICLTNVKQFLQLVGKDTWLMGGRYVPYFHQ